MDEMPLWVGGWVGGWVIAEVAKVRRWYLGAAAAVPLLLSLLPLQDSLGEWRIP